MTDASTPGRLSFRPRPPTATGTAPGRGGIYAIEGGGGPTSLVQAPAGAGPVRLVVLLHGAGGAPERTLDLLAPYVDRERLLLVAPKARAATWDVISGGFGPDVSHIDGLLRRLTEDHPVSGCTIAGFSDGASYALTLGLANGDVFDSVVAFSPGFTAAELDHGRPRFFLSHGVQDRVLPIDRCSRRLVPHLRRAGLEVTYEEFDGGHEVPLDLRDRAVRWLSPGPASGGGHDGAAPSAS